MGAAAKDILDKADKAVRNAADDILVPVMEHFDKKAGMSAEDRQKARDADPKFKEQDDKYREYVRKHKARKAQEEAK